MTLRDRWPLDPAVAFLNHGSFGACPTAVLDHQAELRARMEREPVDFMVRYLPLALTEAREAVAAFVGADPAGFAFVPNASTGVATALANVALAPGDELLTTDHAYQACRNMLEHAARRADAKVVVAPLPFPGATADGIVDAVLAAVTPRTRLALLDHITSPSGLVLPIERLVMGLAERGVTVLIDGAHAPGQVPLDVDRLFALGASYYTGNGHKWTCAPKGAAFLAVREDLRAGFHPLVVSHGYSRPLEDRESRFRAELDWTGTDDPTPALTWPVALSYVGGLVPGGWPAIMAENRRRALGLRDRLCALFGVAAPAEDASIGSLVAVPLPRPAPELFDQLFREHAVEIPVIPWPPLTTDSLPSQWLVRASLHLHVREADLDRLLAALAAWR